jgi:hypothetical protein
MARLFWHCSLWLSIFSLISSSQQRLLEQIPDKIHTLSDDELPRTLRTMLRPQRVGVSDVESGVSDIMRQPPLVVDRKMVWIWQCPLMLMSFSWVTFLLGYECLVLTPLINMKSWNTACSVGLALYACVHRSMKIWLTSRQSSVAATVVGLFTVIQFFVINRVVHVVINETKRECHIVVASPPVTELDLAEAKETIRSSIEGPTEG